MLELNYTIQEATFGVIGFFLGLSIFSLCLILQNLLEFLYLKNYFKKHNVKLTLFGFYKYYYYFISDYIRLKRIDEMQERIREEEP